MNKRFNMKEQLIIFETAKLAKEKGFTLGIRDFAGIDYYKPNGEKLKLKEYSKEFVKFCTLYCTQSILQKWLREVHNIHLLLEPYYDEQKVLVYGFDLIKERTEEETIVEKGFKTYEEALEMGLQEALKLI